MRKKLHFQTLYIFTFLLLGFNVYSTQKIEFYFPMGESRLVDLDALNKRVIGKYGDLRTSDVIGHKHAGIDIKGSYNEMVYSIGEGVVIDVFRDFPNKTVYIKHKDSLDNYIYSVYIHIEDILVDIGDKVNKDTLLGRIFNRQELEDSYFGTAPHLHLEIRHNISDNGAATFNSMCNKALSIYCINPLDFFKDCQNNDLKLMGGEYGY